MSRRSKPAPSRTVFKERSDSIISEISHLQTELVVRNFTLNDVSVADAVRYCVREDHIPILHKAYTLTQERSMQNRITYKSWIPDTNTNLNGLRIEFNVKGSHPDVVLPPDYALYESHAPKDNLSSMPVHLHERLMLEAWGFVDMSMRVSAIKYVFTTLDKLYPQLHMTKLRYLFPGIVPLLERTARRTRSFELAGLAYDLRDTKPEHHTTLSWWLHDGDIDLMRWALPIASETIASLALLTEKDLPADDQALVRFYRTSPWEPQDAPEGTQLEVL